MRSIKMFKQLQKGWLRQMVTSGWPYGKGMLELRGHKTRAIGAPPLTAHETASGWAARYWEKYQKEKRIAWELTHTQDPIIRDSKKEKVLYSYKLQVQGFNMPQSRRSQPQPVLVESAWPSPSTPHGKHRLTFKIIIFNMRRSAVNSSDFIFLLTCRDRTN